MHLQPRLRLRLSYAGSSSGSSTGTRSHTTRPVLSTLKVVNHPSERLLLSLCDARNLSENPLDSNAEMADRYSFSLTTFSPR